MRWPRVYDKIDPDWLRRKYVDEHLTQHEIAKLAGVHELTISRAMRHHGIPARSHRFRQAMPIDPDWLRRKYVDEGLTQREIASLAGVDGAAIQRAMARHDIPSRPPWASGQRLATATEAWHDRDWLYQMHYVERHSYQEMANVAGCHYQTIVQAMRRHDVPSRHACEVGKRRQTGGKRLPPATLYVYLLHDRPVHLELGRNGRPTCPVAYDEVEEIPVVDAGSSPPERRTRRATIVAGWLDDLLEE